MIRVHNVHERRFAAHAQEMGALLDGLASANDRIWPSRWPAMRLDRPLQVGAVGGHGPIRYRIESYDRGRSVRFRMTSPAGFDGFHAFEVSPETDGTTLRHVLEMNTRGTAILTWPLVYRPLHDALVEDCFDRAATALGETPQSRPWSLWVRLLRRGFAIFARQGAS